MLVEESLKSAPKLMLTLGEFSYVPLIRPPYG